MSASEKIGDDSDLLLPALRFIFQVRCWNESRERENMRESRRVFGGFLILASGILAFPTLGGAESLAESEAEKAPHSARKVPALPSSARGALRGDRPDLRREWYLKQRAYPGDSIPAGAYALGGAEYIRRRAAIKDRESKQRAISDGTLSPNGGIPTGAWTMIGPAPISYAGWGFGFNDGAGRLSAVALDPSSATTLLVGSSKGGIWRTTDSGTNWTPVGDNQASLAIASIAFAPSSPNIVYAGTGDDDLGLWGAGVLKSTDSGVSWARVDNGTANGIANGVSLSKLVVDPGNANTVIAAASMRRDFVTDLNFVEAIYRTTDGGATWAKPATATAGSYRSLAIESNCPSRLWAVDSINAKIRRSTDSGATWAAVAATGLPAFSGNSQLTVFHASCTAASGNATIYISDYSSGGLAGSAGFPGVYRSLDNGATFARPGTAGPSGGCLAQCSYDHFLVVDPTDAARLYFLGRDFWTSTDSGANWTNQSQCFDDSNNYYGGNMHSDLHDAAIRGSGASAVVWVAGDGGL